MFKCVCVCVRGCVSECVGACECVCVFFNLTFIILHAPLLWSNTTCIHLVLYILIALL
jgi:hypothetical protein